MSDAHLAYSEPDIAAALADADAFCAAKAARLTPLRRRVLELLLQAGEPAKAYDLLAQLGEDGAAKPPTVYRALDFLLQMGLAHKIESLNAYVACGHHHHGHTAAFLICDLCGAAQELHARGTVAALEAETKSVRFDVSNVVIEARGRCASCAS
ncbi:MAG: transcriptional repressor [Pseudomonadota bacterium]